MTAARDFLALPMFFCRKFKVLKLNLYGAIHFHSLKFYQIFGNESHPLSLRVPLLKIPSLKQQQMRVSAKDKLSSLNYILRRGITISSDVLDIWLWCLYQPINFQRQQLLLLSVLLHAE